MNALVTLTYRLDLPAGQVERIAKRPDDGSREWCEHATHAVEEWVKDCPADALEHVSDEPDVEVMM